LTTSLAYFLLLKSEIVNRYSKIKKTQIMIADVFDLIIFLIQFGCLLFGTILLGYAFYSLKIVRFDKVTRIACFVMGGISFSIGLFAFF